MTEFFHRISAYAPHASKPDQEAQNFYSLLQSEIDKIPNSEKIIILGDLNARTRNEVIEGVRQKLNENELNQSENTCFSNFAFIMNYRIITITEITQIKYCTSDALFQSTLDQITNSFYAKQTRGTDRRNR